MAKSKKEHKEEEKKEIVITEDIAAESKKAFFSILEGLTNSADEPISKEEIEKVIVSCIGVLIFCRSFFVEPKPEKRKQFYSFIHEVMDQMDVKNDQNEAA